jgi:hypothetical protein
MIRPRSRRKDTIAQATPQASLPRTTARPSATRTTSRPKAALRIPRARIPRVGKGVRHCQTGSAVGHWSRNRRGASRGGAGIRDLSFAGPLNSHKTTMAVVGCVAREGVGEAASAPLKRVRSFTHSRHWRIGSCVFQDRDRTGRPGRTGVRHLRHRFRRGIGRRRLWQPHPRRSGLEQSRCCPLIGMGGRRRCARSAQECTFIGPCLRQPTTLK